MGIIPKTEVIEMKQPDVPTVVPEVHAPDLQDHENQGEYNEPALSPVTNAGGKHAIHCLNIIGQIEGHYVLSGQNKTTKG